MDGEVPWTAAGVMVLCAILMMLAKADLTFPPKGMGRKKWLARFLLRILIEGLFASAAFAVTIFYWQTLGVVAQHFQAAISGLFLNKALRSDVTLPSGAQVGLRPAYDLFRSLPVANIEDLSADARVAKSELLLARCREAGITSSTVSNRLTKVISESPAWKSDSSPYTDVVAKLAHAVTESGAEEKDILEMVLSVAREYRLLDIIENILSENRDSTSSKAKDETR